MVSLICCMHQYFSQRHLTNPCVTNETNDCSALVLYQGVGYETGEDTTHCPLAQVPSYIMGAGQ